MDLTPREKDKLLILTAALLADRGVGWENKLDYPEAVAYRSAAILERARDAPAMVLKGEMFPAATTGDPNGSIPGTRRCYADAVLRGPPEVTA